MKVHEYQAKHLFQSQGLTVPQGFLAQTVNEVLEAVDRLGACMLKAQVLVGGRGKAGGIKKVDTRDQAEEASRELFDALIKGHRIERLLVEETLNIEQEMYLSFILDKNAKRPTLLFSPLGGIDIEDIATNHPESLFRLSYDCLFGLQDFQLREILFHAGLSGADFKELFSWLRALDRIAWQYEAEMVEINPLVQADGKLYAADAVLIADDNSLFRHQELQSMQDSTKVDELENQARLKGLNYVRLDGDIGVIANGAGLAMATMDMIAHVQGKPANFLDTGGGMADPEIMKKCLLHLLNDSRVKVVFINIYAEITRSEKVAQGIAQALDESERKAPLIVRLTGVNEEEGKSILRKYSNKTGLEMVIVDTLEIGAWKAVQLAGGPSAWPY